MAAPRVTPASSVHFGLLRGVNVGGRNRLPMDALRKHFLAAGATSAATYIQSGNVRFEVSRRDPRTVADRVRDTVKSEFGIDTPVVLRSLTDLVHCVDASPFPAPEDGSPDVRHVAFLAESPSPARARALDPGRSPPDRAILVGADLHLHLPQGVARTRFTSDYLDRTFGTVCTVRNWRTLEALVAMGSAPGG